MDNLIISGNSCFCFFFMAPFEQFARVWGNIIVRTRMWSPVHQVWYLTDLHFESHCSRLSTQQGRFEWLGMCTWPHWNSESFLLALRHGIVLMHCDYNSEGLGSWKSFTFQKKGTPLEIRTSKKEGTWNTWRSRAVSPTTMPDDLLQP